MARIRGELLIGRPPEVVFDFVADERNEPRFNRQMVSVELLTDEPIGVGSRFAAATRSRGRETTMTVEFVGFERPHRLESVTSMSSMTIRGALTFVEAPGGTLMDWVWDLEAHGALRLAGPLIAWMGRRQEAAIWEALKRLLEKQLNVPDADAPTSRP